MQTLPPKMLHLLTPFMPLFSKRVWPYVQVLFRRARSSLPASGRSARLCELWAWATPASFSATIEC